MNKSKTPAICSPSFQCLRNKSKVSIHTRESKVGEETKKYIRKYRIRHKGVGKPIV